MITGIQSDSIRRFMSTISGFILLFTVNVVPPHMHSSMG